MLRAILSVEHTPGTANFQLVTHNLASSTCDSSDRVSIRCVAYGTVSILNHSSHCLFVIFHCLEVSLCSFMRDHCLPARMIAFGTCNACHHCILLLSSRQFPKVWNHLPCDSANTASICLYKEELPMASLRTSSVETKGYTHSLSLNIDEDDLSLMQMPGWVLPSSFS